MNNELEITWPRVVRVWWAYLWRSLIAMLVAMILGGMAGFVIGFFMGIAGFPERTIQFVAAPIGALIGLGISIFPIKMILGKNFGKFRLVLVETSPSQPPALPLS